MIKRHKILILILSSIILVVNIIAILIYYLLDKKYAISGFNIALFFLFILLITIYRGSNYRLRYEQQKKESKSKQKEYEELIIFEREQIKILWWFLLIEFIINVVVNVIEVLK